MADFYGHTRAEKKPQLTKEQRLAKMEEAMAETDERLEMLV